MELTETQLEVLHNAYVLSRDGDGQVLNDHAQDEAQQLVDAGWLEARTEPNGDTSFWWTQAAETALDLSALTQSVEGRRN